MYNLVCFHGLETYGTVFATIEISWWSTHDALNFDSIENSVEQRTYTVYMSMIERTCGAFRLTMTAAQQKSFVLPIFN